MIVIFNWVILVLLILVQQSCIYADSPYLIKTSAKSHPMYLWEDVEVIVTNQAEHQLLVSKQNEALRMKGTPASSMLPYKLLVSMATVSFRIHDIAKVIYGMLNGIVIPTQMYLFISRDGYLLDEGVKIIPDVLLTLATTKLLRIVYTDNIGPHRKLLPLLAKYYNEPNILIATIDDDLRVEINKSSFLCRVLHQFKRYNQSVIVAGRVRRIGMCRKDVHRYTQYESWDSFYADGESEMMILPVGNGGVLYRPEFFHPVVFSPTLRNITSTADDLLFRLSTLISHVPVAMTYDICTRKYAKRKVASIGYQSNFSRVLPYQEKQSRLEHGRRLQLPLALFTINNLGGKNDRSFRNAIQYLKGEGLIQSFEGDFIARYKNERQGLCLSDEPLRRQNRSCALYNCPSESVRSAELSGAVHVNVSRFSYYRLAQMNQSAVDFLESFA